MGPRVPSSESASILTGSEDDAEGDTAQARVPAPLGMTAEIKNLYRQDGREPWREWTPSKSTPTSEKNALIVRRERELGDTDEPAFALHSITVQSPLIKKQLGTVFAGYKGINTNLKKLEFTAPFHEFFYRWNEFLEAEPTESSDGSEERCHYKLLSDTISDEIKPHIEQASDLMRNNVITFDYLWTIFELGTEVYCKHDGHDRLYVLSNGRYDMLPDGRKLYNLPCRFIDTDGEGFGYRMDYLTIWEFENLKPITELDTVPSRLQPGINGIRSRLTDRGRYFETMKGIYHMAYSGTYERINPPPGAPRKQYLDDEKVIIDCSSFLKYNDEPVSALQPLDVSMDPGFQYNVTLRMADFAPHDAFSTSFGLPPPPPTEYPPAIGCGRARKGRPSHSKRGKAPNSERLSSDHYRLCTPVVKGFCLKAKEWDFLEHCCFDQLVLPHDYKRVIRAFVDAQMSGLDDFDDVIKGKGRGIIMLLSGEPGTGKTLTSESVAETMQKPLYGMSAGELGNSAGEVEQSLHRVLELSTRWGAVLLLDECDVFLERRSTSNLQRNKLVSIFLRLLEYYEGVMFLTTNRVAAFDPAFESRIHLTIHYPNLDFNSKLHIWQTFVKRGSQSNDISDDELAELAQEELNGRQIKNVVKTARLLAASERMSLAMGHVKTVFKIKRGDIERVQA
ncbi:hypothetical protein AK830_g6047 [Neonectria ditissima]|uniref:AAA+ ATPase domain-containing protein n=1 Tax=Neonectria ditissima TaxID=78410 RepID=A0A0P7BHT1_9HYPO|nr:hypothetical protein AK830_g6047 [Neonectria ditissima]